MVDKKPSPAFWAVVVLALPLLNIAVAAVEIPLAGAGALIYLGVLVAVLAAELVLLRGWLRRRGIAPERWLTLAGTLITVETGAVLVLALIAIVAATGD